MDFCLNERMKSYKSDILAERPEMKKMPYGVPEGYFEDFKVSVGGKVPAERGRAEKSAAKRSAAKRSVARPVIFISAAASVAAALVLGAYFIFGAGGTEDFSQEDLLVFDESYINAEYYEYTGSIAEAEYSDDDIIEYLIYSGISLEEIEETIK